MATLGLFQILTQVYYGVGIPGCIVCTFVPIFTQITNTSLHRAQIHDYFSRFRADAMHVLRSRCVMVFFVRPTSLIYTDSETRFK